MSWTKETSCGHESRKCRNRVVEFLEGKRVLDLGCGDEKVVPHAVGVDLFGSAADIKTDLSRPNALYLFADEVFDTVFSSHCLEHFRDTESVLREWWRVLAMGGHLILYLPHRALYPHNENPDHKHEFGSEDILKIMEQFATYQIVRDDLHDEGDEYSFELIIQKLPAMVSRIKPEVTNKKKALVVRYGAAGDMVILTPLLHHLHDDGYEVTVNAKPESSFVLNNNPYVDKVLLQSSQVIPNTQLLEYHAEISKDYDKFVNLCESIERGMLFEQRDRDKFYASKESREAMARGNYYDRMFEIAGYPDIKGKTGELFLSAGEKYLLRLWEEKYKDCFKIIWCVRGSSDHKIYPHLWDVAEELTETYHNIRVFLVGDSMTQILESPNHKIRSCIGAWGFRQAMIATSAADLVISPETAILNASGCFDTPKIGLLSHSSKENLTKYFKNDYSLSSESKCSPCHRLVHNSSECDVEKVYGLPVCLGEGIPAEKVFSTAQDVYCRWIKERIG